MVLLAVLSIQADPGLDAVRALLRLRESWGAKPGDRGRALVALLSGGWSELSKEEIDGLPIGPLIARELDRFEGDPTADAWAALALTEGYGLTGRRRESARRAAERVRQAPAAGEEARFLQSWVLAAAAGEQLVEKGPEPPPFKDPVRQALVAWWWRGEKQALPDFDARSAAPLDLYLRDLVISGRPHRRSEHEALRRQAVVGKPAAKDVEEAAFRVLVAAPKRCWPCRNVFRRD